VKQQSGRNVVEEMSVVDPQHEPALSCPLRQACRRPSQERQLAATLGDPIWQEVRERAKRNRLGRLGGHGPFRSHPMRSGTIQGLSSKTGLADTGGSSHH
jgi:hypothetical protein